MSTPPTSRIFWHLPSLQANRFDLNDIFLSTYLERDWEAEAEAIEEDIAYAARYGRQSRIEVLSWPIRELHEFNAQISDIIKAESGKK